MSGTTPKRRAATYRAGGGGLVLVAHPPATDAVPEVAAEQRSRRTRRPGSPGGSPRPPRRGAGAGGASTAGSSVGGRRPSGPPIRSRSLRPCAGAGEQRGVRPRRDHVVGVREGDQVAADVAQTLVAGPAQPAVGDVDDADAGSRAAYSSAIAPEPSVEPSSTTRTSSPGGTGRAGCPGSRGGTPRRRTRAPPRRPAVTGDGASWGHRNNR